MQAGNDDCSEHAVYTYTTDSVLEITKSGESTCLPTVVLLHLLCRDLE